MFCSNCGNKIDEGVKFCSGCGKELHVKSENVSPNRINKSVPVTAPKMRLLDKMIDIATSAVSGKEKVRIGITPEQLAEVVYNKFILPAHNASNEDALIDIKKIVDSPWMNHDINSKDSDYILRVSNYKDSFPFGRYRDAMVIDNNTSNIYQINSSSKEYNVTSRGKMP